jgi:2-keto-4-pentenoate hydratase/2-oxohepta-3-ene-1,7-dioic acid hydratase in catechol pathway
MRLVTYDRGGARRLGAWVGRAVVDLPDAVGHPAFPTTMETLVARSGGTTLDAARDALMNPQYLRECRVSDPRLLAPVIPISLLERRFVLGPDDRVPWPPLAEQVDYHLEVACVIGRSGRDLSAAQAADVVFGYTLMNDWSALPGKAKGRRAAASDPERFATSLGPCIVTPDEFDPTQGRLIARVDGEVWSMGSLGLAVGTFPDLIAELSRSQPLYPGDIVGSGTFQGGCAFDLGLRLEAGSVVELEAEGIGVLRNPVGAPPVGRAA